MAVDADALTSLAAVKTYLGLTDTNTTRDTFVDDLIDRFTDLAEVYCNVKFKSASYTEYHNGSGKSGTVNLDEYPVTAITSLHDDVDREYGSDHLVASADYVWWDYGVIELDEDVFDKGFKNIKVVYTAGYATMPEDLQQAAVEQVAWNFKQSSVAGGSGFLGLSSRGMADGSMSKFVESLLPSVKEILDRYQKMGS